MIHALAAVFQGRPASTLAQKSTKARTLAAGRVRETWQAHFHAQGQRHPLARMRMLDDFNEGWLEFEGVSRAAHGRDVARDRARRTAGEDAGLEGEPGSDGHRALNV